VGGGWSVGSATDIYSSEKRLQSAVQHLVESAVLDENKQLILRFINSRRAQGIKAVRLKKLVSLLRDIALLLNKPLLESTREDIEAFLCYLEQRNYSGWTKSDYKVILRTFYKWLLGNDEEYPLVVKWIKNKEPKDSLLPEELLTEEEVLRLVSNAKYIRDKAFIYLLWESGARIGEMLTLRIKNITFAEPLSSILVNGKTGQRRIPIMKSAPLLREWLLTHPFKDDTNALVWVKTKEYVGNFRKQGTRETTEALCYSNIKKILKHSFKDAGIQKKHNPHIFRHSRATFLAKHLTEAQLKQFFGWTQSSDMTARYVHLSGRDLDEILFRVCSV
jgi:integrase